MTSDPASMYSTTITKFLHLTTSLSEWWGAGVVICLEQSADLHTDQLLLLPLTISWFSKIQIGFTFLVPAHPGSPGQRAVKRVCVCVCTSLSLSSMKRLQIIE